MPFKPGHQKVGGRKRGTPNKTTLPIAELCEFHQCSPIEVLIKLCQDTDKALRLSAARELAQYLYPKRKALEVDSTINIELAKKAEEYANLPKEEQILLMEAELKRLKGK